MNPFEMMLNAEISIEKPDGQVLGPVLCILADNKATVFDEKLDLAEGDTVLHKLPNGKIERFRIADLSFTGGFSAMPSQFQLKLEREGAKKRPSGAPSITITNAQGIQIGDYNTQTLVGAFQALASAIEASEAPPEEKEEARSRLRAFLEHPIVAAIVGASAGAILS